MIFISYSIKVTAVQTIYSLNLCFQKKNKNKGTLHFNAILDCMDQIIRSFQFPDTEQKAGSV